MLKATATGLVAMIAGAATPEVWPMDRDLYRGNYRVAVEMLYLDVDFLSRFGFELPMFPQGVQDVYYNDLVVTYLSGQGCTAFRTLSTEWHPYTLQGIVSGLEAIKATGTSDIVRRVYGSHDASADEKCSRDLKLIQSAENIQAMNEELLWSSPSFAWTGKDERDATLELLLERSMLQKDRRQ